MSLSAGCELRLQVPPSGVEFLMPLVAMEAPEAATTDKGVKTEKGKRKYSGPVKGSDEAKERMARVRAAQWARNGLVVSNPKE